MSEEEKTLAATPMRLSRARGEGHVAVSREVAPLLAMTAVVVFLVTDGPRLMTRAAVQLVSLFELIGNGDGAAIGLGVRLAGSVVGQVVLPVMAVTAAAGVAAVLGQGGLVVRPSALTPDLSRLNPGAGFARLVSGNQALVVVKALFKLGIMSAVLGSVLWGESALLIRSLQVEPRLLTGVMVNAVVPVAAALLAVQAGVAAIDVAVERVRFARRLRMSAEEVKEEQKSIETSPQMRARLRAVRQALAKMTLTKAMARASVVITNPTHYAVALAYRRDVDQAPVLVAKGTDRMAERIRELARENRVPVVPNPPLARALYTQEIDSAIPAEHFKAVAEIIAYIWRLEAEMLRRRIG